MPQDITVWSKGDTFKTINLDTDELTTWVVLNDGEVIRHPGECYLTFSHTNNTCGNPTCRDS